MTEAKTPGSAIAELKIAGLKTAGLRIARCTIAGLLAVPVLSAAPLFAATAPVSAGVRESGAIYDAAHEVTVHGVIQELVTARVVGSPVGAHLLVSASPGLVDVHAGPFLTKDAIRALQAGTPVQVVGAMVWLHGKPYLLARLLTVNGQTLTLRSEGGVLLQQHSNRTAKSAKNARAQSNGEVR